MTATLAKQPGPGKGRLAAIVLLGPLVGAIALVTPTMIAEPPPGGSSDLIELGIMIVFFSYILGLVPAMLAATAYALAYPRLSRLGWMNHLLVCLLIGAIGGALGVVLSISAMERQFSVAPQFLAVGAFAGATALAVTASAFRKRLD